MADARPFSPGGEGFPASLPVERQPEFGALTPMPDTLTAAPVSRRSAFADVAPKGRFLCPGIIDLRDPGPRPKILLRGRPSPRWREAAAAVLGVAPPEQPLTAARGPSADILWLGPDEWLVLPDTGEDIALAAAGLAAAAVGDGLPDLELSGPYAREVLAGGTALDLHPRAFTAGRVARTRLARIGVVLHQTADHPVSGPVYRLHVERPWAGYLWSWLADAALDYPVNDAKAPR